MLDKTVRKFPSTLTVYVKKLPKWIRCPRPILSYAQWMYYFNLNIGYTVPDMRERRQYKNTELSLSKVTKSPETAIIMRSISVTSRLFSLIRNLISAVDIRLCTVFFFFFFFFVLVLHLTLVIHFLSFHLSCMAQKFVDAVQQPTIIPIFFLSALTSLDWFPPQLRNFTNNYFGYYHV